MHRVFPRTLIFASVLAFAFMVPVQAQERAREQPDSMQAATSGPGMTPSLDPRLFPPLPRVGRSQSSSSAVDWPDNPAVGGLLGGVLGCAAGYALAWLFIGRETGNDPGWGCIIGGVLGMGAGSGWRIPSEGLEGIGLPVPAPQHH